MSAIIRDSSVTRAKLASGAVGKLGVVSKTTTYTALTSDDVILCSGSAFPVTLYTAVGNTGRQIQIKKTDATVANVITVNTTSSQTIDGATSVILSAQYDSLTLVSDGANWQILNFQFDGSWKSFTSAFLSNGGTPGAPGTNTQTTFYRRIRAGIEIIFHIAQTALGTTGSSTFYTWGIPNTAQWNMDTTKVVSIAGVFSGLSYGSGYGSASISNNASVYSGLVVIADSTHLGVTMPSATQFWGSGAAAFGGASTITATMQVQLPIKDVTSGLAWL